MTPRLFSVDGKPSLSLSERRLLRECERSIVPIDQARMELCDAIVSENVDGCVAAGRRLLAVGLLFKDAADSAAPEHHGFSMKVKPASQSGEARPERRSP